LARKLRKEMTDAERVLWHRLNRRQVLGVSINRQKPLGKYIVDFYCASAHLVVEVDGGQHFEADGKREDELRDAFLRSLGLEVLRVSDREVLTNLEGVMSLIWDKVQKRKA
jgi:very-short-patch-repair endonuclease